ncbi:MAG TPA: hypothetical protein DHV63_04170 [Pseudomonas sp.]|nr:hypothetical protein [Pseudomonas sp.]
MVVDWRPLSTTALQAYRERRVGFWWTARWCAAPDVLASSREASLFRLKLPEAHPELIDLSTNLVGASGRADALDVEPDRRQRGCPASRDNRRCGAPPLAPALPERCLLNSSLSKTIAPGLRLRRVCGWAVLPGLQHGCRASTASPGDPAGPCRRCVCGSPVNGSKTAPRRAGWPGSLSR